MLERGERSRGVAPRGAPFRHGDEGVHVVGREGDELLGEPAGLLGPPQPEQRLHLAEQRVGPGGVGGAGLAEALQRLAVQAAPREDAAQQHGGVRPVGAALHRAGRLGRGHLHQPLAHVVARERERIVARRLGRLRRHRRRRGELLKDVVHEPLIEREVLADRLGAHVGGNLGGDADRPRLELEVDREGEFLRHVVGIELERAFRRAQRAVEVAQVRQRKAQVVVRARVRGVRFHRPGEGVARVGEALQLHQHDADAVPRRRRAGLRGEYLAIRLERQLEPPQLKQQQG